MAPLGVLPCEATLEGYPARLPCEAIRVGYPGRLKHPYVSEMLAIPPLCAPPPPEVLLTVATRISTHLSLSSEIRVKLPQLLWAEELPEEPVCGYRELHHLAAVIHTFSRSSCTLSLSTWLPSPYLEISLSSILSQMSMPVWSAEYSC